MSPGSIVCKRRSFVRDLTPLLGFHYVLPFTHFKSFTSLPAVAAAALLLLLPLSLIGWGEGSMGGWRWWW